MVLILYIIFQFDPQLLNLVLNLSMPCQFNHCHYLLDENGWCAHMKPQERLVFTINLWLFVLYLEYNNFNSIKFQLFVTVYIWFFLFFVLFLVMLTINTAYTRDLYMKPGYQTLELNGFQRPLATFLTCWMSSFY